MRLLYHNLQLNSLKPHLLSHVLSGEPTANQGPPQPLQKDEKDNLPKKKKTTLERVREKFKKKMERKKGDFPYESSLGGVRLMTSPL